MLPVNGPQFYSNNFFENSARIQESEIKSHQEGYSRELSQDEIHRLNSILDKSIQVDPISGTSVQFKIREILDFLNLHLYKRGFIAEPSCEIGGGSTRQILDDTWEYSDVDVSYHLIRVNDGAILDIVSDFIIEKLIKINCLSLNSSTKQNVIDNYLHNKDQIVNGGKFVQRFIALGVRGIDLKFIADETARWNVASYDSFYISYPLHKVRSVNAGIFCNKEDFEQNLKHLSARQWSTIKVEEVNGLIFAIIHAQSHGICIPIKDQKLALQQFCQKYPPYNPSSKNRLIQKFHRHLKNHSCTDLRKIFTFINFLSLIQNLENHESRKFYIDILTTSWNAKEGPFDSILLPEFVKLIKSDFYLTKDLLTLIYGVIFYEFVNKNPKSSYTFNIHTFPSIGTSLTSWLFSVTFESKTHYLTIPQIPPEELTRSFLNSWNALERFEKSGHITNFFKDLKFTSLTYDEKCKFQIMHVLMDAFDQPPLLNLLTEKFPQSNPNSFYASVKHAMPQLIGANYLERKLLLGTLWKALIEAKQAKDTTIEKFVISMRRLLRFPDIKLEAENLQPLLRILESMPSPEMNSHIKRAVNNFLIYLIHQIKLQPHPSLLIESLKLINLAEQTKFITKEKLDSLLLSFLNACHQIKDRQDLVEIIELIIHVNQIKLGLKAIKVSDATNYLSQILFESISYPDIFINESRIKKIYEACLKSVINSFPNTLWHKASLALLTTLHQYAEKMDLPYVWQALEKLMSQLPKNIITNLPFSESTLLLNLSKTFFLKESELVRKHYDLFLHLLESTQKISVEPLKNLQVLIHQNGNVDSNIGKLFIKAVFKINQSIGKQLFDEFKVTVLNTKDKTEMECTFSALPFFNAVRSLIQSLSHHSIEKEVEHLVDDLIHSLNSNESPLTKSISQKISNNLMEGIIRLVPIFSSQAEKILEAARKTGIFSVKQENEAAFFLMQYFVLQNTPHSMSKVEYYLDRFFFHSMSNKDIQDNSTEIIRKLLDNNPNNHQMGIKVLCSSIQSRIWNPCIEQHCINLLVDGFREINKQLLFEMQLLAREIITASTRGCVFSENRMRIFLELLLDGKQYSLFQEAWDAYPYLSIFNAEEARLILQKTCQTEHVELIEIPFKIFYKEPEKYFYLAELLLNFYSKMNNENFLSRAKTILEMGIKLESLNGLEKVNLFEMMFKYVTKICKRTIEIHPSTSKFSRDKKNLTPLEQYQKYIKYLDLIYQRCITITPNKQLICSLYIKALLTVPRKESFNVACSLFVSEKGLIDGDLAFEILECFTQLSENHAKEQWGSLMSVMHLMFEKGLLHSKNKEDPLIAQFSRIKNWMVKKGIEKPMESHEELMNRQLKLMRAFIITRIGDDHEDRPLMQSQDLILKIIEALTSISMFVGLEALNLLINSNLSPKDQILFESDLQKHIHNQMRNVLLNEAKNIEMLVKEKVCNDPEIENAYEITKNYIEKYQNHLPFEGRKIVHLLIKHTLKLSTKWVKSADRLLKHSLLKGLFGPIKSDNNLLSYEEDEKEDSEIVMRLNAIKLLIIHAACNGKLSSVALHHLSLMIENVNWKDSSAVEDLYNLALKVVDAIVLNITESTEEDHEKRVVEYYSFVSHFVRIILQQSVSRQQFEDLRVLFIIQLINRAIHYPILDIAPLVLFEWTLSPSFFIALQNPSTSKILHQMIMILFDVGFKSIMTCQDNSFIQDFTKQLLDNFLKVKWPSSLIGNFLIPFIKDLITRSLFYLDEANKTNQKLLINDLLYKKVIELILETLKTCIHNEAFENAQSTDLEELNKAVQLVQNYVYKIIPEHLQKNYIMQFDKIHKNWNRMYESSKKSQAESKCKNETASKSSYCTIQ